MVGWLMNDRFLRILKKKQSLAWLTLYPGIYQEKLIENTTKPQRIQPTSRPRFEPNTFQIKI
jgi:hypothetical protein